jgi:hypothetical protein
VLARVDDLEVLADEHLDLLAGSLCSVLPLIVLPSRVGVRALAPRRLDDTRGRSERPPSSRQARCAAATQGGLFPIRDPSHRIRELAVRARH